jgi:glycosyltransferase involved in cell wall biosynthesis
MSMHDAPLLSLVIPVYNVAPYLRACFDSIQRLTPPVEEIIVVDDGSTDDCPAILAEYAEKMPQMRVIRQENGGLSAARNTGMKHATGKYLAFVDSDDFLAPAAYARPLERAEAEQLEMVIFNANFHFEGRQNDRAIYEAMPATGVISGDDWLRRRLQKNQLPHMVWMHLYRRDFLLNGGWQFVPGLIHEDVIWTTQLLLAAHRIAYEPNIAYFYRLPIRRFSSEQNQRRLEKIVASSVFNAHALEKLLTSRLIDDELQKLIRHQLVDGAFSVFHKLDQMPDHAARKSIISRLRQENWFGFLWQNASGLSQHRKIAKRYLRSFLAR